MSIFARVVAHHMQSTSIFALRIALLHQQIEREKREKAEREARAKEAAE